MKSKRFVVWMSILALAPFLTGSRSTVTMEPQTWYVTTTGSDENDCSMVETPCATIAGALGRPGFIPGDRVLVAEGVYRIEYGDSRYEVGVYLTKSAVLSGGWDPSFTHQPGVADIENKGRGVTVDPGITVSIQNFDILGNNLLGLYNEGKLSLDRTRVNSINESGIYNKGSIKIENSSLTHSYGCGILNAGVIEMSDSLVIGNYGCGVTSYGTMTIERSTIQGSRLRYGCTGVSNSGVMRVSDSAIVDNGWYYPNVGAGLCNWGETTLINVVISGNRASTDPGGGIYNEGPKLELYNTTVAYNQASAGGGIYNQSGSVAMQNSLVAQNTALDGGRDCQGTLNSLGYNLLGDSQGCTLVEGEGDLLDKIALVYPAVPLESYPPFGTPPPYAPLAWMSPAVDAGDAGGCRDDAGRLLLTDQRGVGRVGRCDIGAYEYDPAYDPLPYTWLAFVEK